MNENTLRKAKSVAEERFRKYEERLIPTGIESFKRVMKTRMSPKGIENYERMVKFGLKTYTRQAMEEVVLEELATKEILDEEGIFGNIRVSYLNFGRTICRGKRSHGGVALQKVVIAEKVKFKNYGLNEKILDKIANRMISL